MRFINQHSFILAGVGLMMLVAFLLLRDGAKWSDALALAALAGGLALAFFLLRPGKSTLSAGERILARIGAGKPVLLEFQSNY